MIMYKCRSKYMSFTARTWTRIRPNRGTTKFYNCWLARDPLNPTVCACVRPTSRSRFPCDIFNEKAGPESCKYVNPGQKFKHILEQLCTVKLARLGGGIFVRPSVRPYGRSTVKFVRPYVRTSGRKAERFAGKEGMGMGVS